jgi:hypothetical protein
MIIFFLIHNDPFKIKFEILSMQQKQLKILTLIFVVN